MTEPGVHRPRSLGAWLGSRKRPLVLGHRGVRGVAPENTLLSFETALGAGADGVELDVRISADGAVVVLHDRELNRVSAGAERASAEELGLARLRCIELGQGQTIPTLEEVLDWALARQTRLNVELKTDVSAPEALVSSVAARLLGQRASPELVLLSSFSQQMAQQLAERLPNFCVAWLVDDRNALELGAGALAQKGIVAIHPHHSLVPSELGPLRALCPIVNTWTVNDIELGRQLARRGVDAIITDDPAGLLGALTADSG